jgi:hypothetical protein
MAYSSFKKLQQVNDKFGLTERLVDLFPKIKSVKPSAWLLRSMEIAYEMPLTNEKVKGEKLISPLLSEVAHLYKDRITLFSGEDITANSDLTGPCDFIFALHPPKIIVEAPIISLVEAKDEDMEYGVAQCAAQMYGAKLFNDNKQKPIDVIYGCATTGVEWKFLKLENNVICIDKKSYTSLPQILGVWSYIIKSYLN